MNTFISYRAAHGDALIVEFTVDIEKISQHKTLEDMREIYTSEAVQLCQALRHYLPGGLFDALFAQMAAYKAGLFIVAHEPVAALATEGAP